MQSNFHYHTMQSPVGLRYNQLVDEHRAYIARRPATGHNVTMHMHTLQLSFLRLSYSCKGDRDHNRWPYTPMRA